MVIAALLVSVALLATPSAAQPAAQSQPPADKRPPYTIEGVRRAASAADQPKTETVETVEPVEAPRPISRSAARQQIEVATWTPDASVRLPRDNRLITLSLAPTGPVWHQEFLSMATPDIYSPFAYMSNPERVQAVASSMAFALGVEGLTRLVKAIARQYRGGKLEELRGEIDLETALVEQRYKEYLAAEQTKQKDEASGTPVRKRPQ